MLQIVVEGRWEPMAETCLLSFVDGELVSRSLCTLLFSFQ
jgi:hypothetical protein